MHKYLPRPPADSQTYRFSRRDNPYNGPISHRHKPKQGDLRTTLIRAVCRQCNNGWMSKIENAAKPFLKPLIVGEAITLSESETEVLARWITVKCMVLEHNRPGQIITPRADRVLIRKTGNIPFYYNIFVTSHSWNENQYYEGQDANFYPGPREHFPKIDGTDKNIRTVTWIIGNMLIYVVASTLSGFDQQAQMEIERLNAYRIWPPNSPSIEWPSLNPFSQQEVLQLSRSLHTWLEFSSRPVYNLMGWDGENVKDLGIIDKPWDYGLP
jgi:hypothetical protein